jgi:hypothetical protein
MKPTRRRPRIWPILALAALSLACFGAGGCAMTFGRDGQEVAAGAFVALLGVVFAYRFNRRLVYYVERL